MFSNCSDSCICELITEIIQSEVVFMIKLDIFDQNDAANILNIAYSCRRLNWTQSRVSCLILAHHYFGHAYSFTKTFTYIDSVGKKSIILAIVWKNNRVA